MDFINKLLKSKDLIKKSPIIIVINKLTKYVHFILFEKRFNAE